ncbi:uncharacterized protein [Chelonus insularis]|uniref:uncharacterized protein isoform X2 n=1 Tax=Chelonus insularis TaxID=460826 RepID=UPI00158D5179|nr:uncharacterized protein LOC118072991 isoform X2 [Chelonus insularis]
MKVWILLGLLSIFKVSSVFTLEQESTKLKEKHITIHKVIEHLQNYSFPNNISNNDKSIAKNAILIIVEGSQGEDAWKKFKENHSFPIEGFLSSCKNASNNSLLLSDHKNCQCEELLKKNINELMTWAQLMKEMSTATISGNNSTLPSFLNNGNPVHGDKKFLGNKKNKNEPTFFQQRPRSEDSWHLNHTNNHPTLSSSVLNMNSPVNRSNAYDALWNFISTISRMHSLIFRTIFKVIGKHFIHNRVPSQHKSMFPIGPPKFIDLISNTLMDLKLTSNSKGFLLIVITPGDQLSRVYQTIETQVPFNETLMVVTGECSKDDQTIPYYVSGLKPHLLLNITAVFELPIALKSTLDGCHGICDNKTFPLTISIKDGPKKRKIRSGDDDETQQDDEKAEESDADSNELFFIE